ncbi:Alpha/beta hydrolase fold [uncultured Eubacteriales bacterium]|uniref:Alpha/beta hydrolase fold n=1 Tax=uncultured Eubacteriales bacterium TaxID=172733 RepID=A0A212JG56_9FIRM|nr:Alpha/beta hydrolase fold [uncultured Eubacteriales bacterium]
MKPKTRLKRLIILVLPAMLLLVGAIWQSVMVHIERKTYTAIGEYADLKAYRAHYYSKGDGDVAFVFITGSGTPCAYTDFYALQNKLSTIGRTITFDHAGSGWSTGTETARTIENLVNELSILIDTVAPNKPIYLLCHSLGSLEAIGYAQAHPERVAGIIFLDSGCPEFYSTDSELLAQTMNRGSAIIRTAGINRLFGELGLLLPIYGENIRNQQLPDNLKSLDKAMYYRFTGNSSSLNTIKLINESAAKVLAGPSLGQIPTLVLSSDSGNEWNDVQLQLASWSESSRQITVNDSEHYLYWSNYDEVENYIDEFVKDSLK